MKAQIRLFLAAGFLTASAAAQQPPLIDRELFFGDPEISGAEISPDGKYIAFLKPLNKTRNIWVKKTEEPFDKAHPITNDTKRPIPGYLWSRDGKFILFAQDQAGDENYNLYAVNPADAPAPGSEVPAARNLTDIKAVRVAPYAVPRSEPDIVYIGLNDRDKAWHDLYKLRISTGERTLLRKNTDRVTNWVFDRKDQLRLATRSAENGDTETLRVDATGFNKIYSCNVLETCDPVQFQKDGKHFYMETNKGGVNLSRLVSVDPETGKEEVAESDPLNKVDFGHALFSEVSDEMIATVYVDEKQRIYWKDKNFEADYKWLAGKLPGKEISFPSHTRDEQIWLISAASDTEPGETYLFDRKARKLTLQYKIREKLPRQDLARMEPVRYESSDGLEIPAYLTLPKGVPAKNLPVVIFPHGGPWARDTWGYRAFSQFLANRGYAVLNPNFRGSTGYGKQFLDKGNLQWGEKMQDDLTWGGKYSDRERHRGSEADRHHGRLLRRLCHSGWCCLHSGCIRSRRFDRRPVEPDHSARIHSSVLGGRPQDVLPAHGRSQHAGRQSTPGEAVTPQFGRQNPHAAPGGSRRQRSACQQSGIRPDRRRIARSAVSGRVHRCAGRGPRLRPSRE